MSDNRVLQVLSVCLVLGLILTTAGAASADIPRSINYQMRITDSVTGDPLFGSHDMTFRLYDAEVGGVLLWSENRIATADSSGVLSVILGSVSPVDISFEGPCWLEVEVDDEILSPRREIVSVPYAFRALNSDSLGGLSSDSFSLVGHTHDEYVTEGEAAAITAEMIADGEITDSDIAPDAGIDPSKIDGTAWTSENDGSGSGLDADRLDGYHADAFADSGHVHDDRYYRQTELNSYGTINQGSNPVDWTRLKNVPGGFADGTDDVGGAGDGHSLDAAGGGVIDVVYVNDDADVGIHTLTPAATLHVRGSFRTGNPEAGYSAELFGAGVGTRLYWNAPKGALRAGTDLGLSFWDDAHTGQHSVAFGEGTEASGAQSFAVGIATKATGEAAIAMGETSRAEGDYSFAVGRGAQAMSFESIAMGWQASAYGVNSVAIGEYVSANGNNSFVLGSGSNIAGHLKNTITNSLIIGFNDTQPVLFVGGSHRRVGIGTTSPMAHLDVTGPVKIGEGGWSPSDNTSLAVFPDDYTAASIPLVVHGGSGVEALIVYGDGKVGMGNDNPLARLHIEVDPQLLSSDALQFEDVIVEDLDAVLGLYSGDAGNAGSAISFAEVDVGDLVDKWGIIRETTRGGSGGGSGLRFTFGTGSDQFTNPTVLYLDDSGEVGLGTTGPLARAHVRETSISLPSGALQSEALVVEAQDAVLGLYSNEAGSAGSAITFGEITSGSLVDKWGIVRETTGGGKGLRFTFGTGNNQFNNTTVMYLDDDGDVGIGTKTPGSYRLYVNGEAYSTVAWTPSDLRLKQDIASIENALDKVLGLRGILFRWRTEEYAGRGFPEGEHYGVIAQDAEEVLPEIAKVGPGGDKAVAYSEIIPVLVEAVRELKAENDDLKQRIEALEGAKN